MLRSHWQRLAVLLLVYAALLLPTVNRQGISWDEQNDLWVTQSYLVRPYGWLTGSDIDPSQTRLPMFTVALAYNLLGTSDLITGRVLSVLAGALTLLAIYIYCHKRLDHRRGLLAVGLLATSPFFLAFARVAFTETDIYPACTLAWLLVCVVWYGERPTLGRAAIVGVVLGLCVSAKFTMLAVFPAIWYAVAQSGDGRGQADSPAQGDVLWLWTNWILITILLGRGFLIVSRPSAYSGETRLIHFGLVVLAWILPLAWAGWKRGERPSRAATAAYITALALLTFLVIPPEHLTNPQILRSLAGRFTGGMPHSPSFAIEAGVLHILSVVLKSSPVIGAGLLLSLILASLPSRWKQSQVLLAIVWLYFAGLLILPLAQTFYVIPLLPLLAILAADQFLTLWERRPKTALGIALPAALLLCVDLALCYPDYNLSGYQYLGRRTVAGRTSIGYRSVVQTPSDGVKQAFDWLNAHARPGDRVLAYVLPWNIVEATTRNSAYSVEPGFTGSLQSDPDYLVVHINAQIQQGWWTDVSKGEEFKPPYDAAWVEAHYTRVFAVRRRFGIEMASVWRRAF